MSLFAEHRHITPRLGTHYAIFVSTFVSMILLLLIFEQLGTRKLWLSHIMIAGPVIAYLSLAALTRSIDVQQFFAASRRVPPVFGGLALAASALGGVGLFAFTGIFYLIGLDAACLAIGWVAGLLLAAILIVPFMRKSGAYTMPAFLHQRFRHRPVGAVAGLLVLPPALLLLAAELRLGAYITSLFASLSYGMALFIAAIVVATLPLLGGLRALTWSQSVQYLVMAAGYLAPLFIIGLLLTNLPLPQLTVAGIFERLTVQELAVGTLPGEPRALGQALSEAGLRASIKPFLLTFGAISRHDFILLLLCCLAGTAAMPALLMRAGTSTSVFDARRTSGWGVLFAAVVLISVPTYAAFTKFLMLQDLAGTALSQLPSWIARLRDSGLADIGDASGDGVISAGELLISPAGMALTLPIIGGFPFIVVAMVAAAGIAASLAAASAHAMAIGASLSEDVLRGVMRPRATPSARLLAARTGIVAAAVLSAWYVAQSDFEILHMAAWAM